MASDDSTGPRPGAPIVLRIKLRYDDVEVMVQRFAANVGKSGLFLPTRSLQPIGAEIKFELRLADDTPVLVGLGRVKAAVAPDPHSPRTAFGMAVELMRVTPQSRALILRMLERRREAGLPELGLPMASDVDAARRAEGDPGRDYASGPVVTPAASAAAPAAGAAASGAPGSAAPLASTSTPGIAARAGSTSTPGIVTRAGATSTAGIAAPAASASTPGTGMSSASTSAPGIAVPATSSSGVLTAPRRTTGPVTVPKVAAIAPLAPEPPRRTRPALSEILERASGPVVSAFPAVPGLDDNVDIGAAIARARALAGGSLDAELEALSETAAAPVEISIDAASAELARQLGGSGVRRDRSAGVIAPPAKTAAGSVVVPIEPATDDELEAAALPAAPVGNDGRDGSAMPGGATLEVRAIADADANDGDANRDAAGTGEALGDATRADPSLGGTSRAPIDRPAADLDSAESSAAAADAANAGMGAGRDEGDPGDHVRAFGEPVAVLTAIGAGPAGEDEAAAEPDDEPSFGQSSDGRVELSLAEIDSDERTEMGAMPSAASGFELPADVDDLDDAEPEPAAGDDADLAIAVAHDGDGDGGAVEPPLELGVDEFDDFEIIAEADAADEDLLASHGEQDASGRRGRGAASDGALDDAPDGAAYEAPMRPSELDFAERLDLGEDSYAGSASRPISDEFSAGHVIDAMQDELTGQHPGIRRPGLFDRELDPHAISAGAALAAFDTGEESYDVDPEDGDRDGEQDVDMGDHGRAGSLGDAEVTDDPDAYAARGGVQPIFEIDPSSSFTLAGIPSDSMDEDVDLRSQGDELIDPPRPAPSAPHVPAASQPLPHDRRAVASPDAARRRFPLSLHEAPVEDFELEHALEALDVDLDDLSIPHAATQLQRPQTPSRPATPAHTPAPQPRNPSPSSAPQPRRLAPSPTTTPPRAPAATPSRAVIQRAHPGHPGQGGRVVPHAPSEDGVEIDFEDDD